ncbi:UNVERIFIED_CONTAM: A2L zinc ribbon protein [Acetivibrio alkalicellulosi]
MSDETLNEQSSSSEVYMCPNCGGNVEYDISSQMLKCPYCDTEINFKDEDSTINDYRFDDVAKIESKSSWGNEVSVVKCDGCGAETVVQKDQTALQCNYCGSSHVLASKQTAGIKPEAIIPFKIDKHKADELYIKWIKGRWLAPGNLKIFYQSDMLHPVYVPYWTYNSNSYNRYTARGGKYYYVNVTRNGKSVRERRTRWFNVSGRFEYFFDYVEVNASKNYNDSIMKKIEPYNNSGLEAYKPQYISGYTAERYSRNVVEGFEYAKSKMKDILNSEVRKRVLRNYDTVSNIRINSNYIDVKYKHVLHPIWTALYDYKGKKYRYIVNGQTGKISGQAPLSPLKLTLLIIIGLAILMTILYFTDSIPFFASSMLYDWNVYSLSNTVRNAGNITTISL